MEFIVLVALLGIIPGYIAHRKGYNFFEYWLCGACLFIVALPWTILMKPRVVIPDNNTGISAPREKSVSTPEDINRSKVCPRCFEPIRANLDTCPMCKARVSAREPGSLPRQGNPSNATPAPPKLDAGTVTGGALTGLVLVGGVLYLALNTYDEYRNDPLGIHQVAVPPSPTINPGDGLAPSVPAPGPSVPLTFDDTSRPPSRLTLGNQPVEARNRSPRRIPIEDFLEAYSENPRGGKIIVDSSYDNRKSIQVGRPIDLAVLARADEFVLVRFLSPVFKQYGLACLKRKQASWELMYCFLEASPAIEFDNSEIPNLITKTTFEYLNESGGVEIGDPSLLLGKARLYVGPDHTEADRTSQLLEEPVRYNDKDIYFESVVSEGQQPQVQNVLHLKGKRFPITGLGDIVAPDNILISRDGSLMAICYSSATRGFMNEFVRIPTGTGYEYKSVGNKN